MTCHPRHHTNTHDTHMPLYHPLPRNTYIDVFSPTDKPSKRNLMNPACTSEATSLRTTLVIMSSTTARKPKPRTCLFEFRHPFHQSRLCLSLKTSAVTVMRWRSSNVRRYRPVVRCPQSHTTDSFAKLPMGRPWAKPPVGRQWAHGAT